MIYQLQKEYEYARHIKTNLTFSSNDVVGNNEYNFKDGILTVNIADTTKYFFIDIPISNLVIGNKIIADLDVKLISGTIRPNLSITFKDAISWLGTEGIHRPVKNPRTNLRDFQNLKLETIFEGYKDAGSGLVVTPNHDGVLYVRFGITSGWGTSKFKIKNFKVEAEKGPSGISLSTKMYSGLLFFDPASKVWSITSDSKSHNSSDITITQSTLGVDLTFSTTFSKRIIPFFDTTYQAGGNNNKYKVVVNTNNLNTVTLNVLDVATNTRVNIADIDHALYINYFMITE